MIVEHLRKLRNAHPFEPFCISMSDGRNFEIQLPESMAISPCDDTVVVIEADGEFSILDIPLMKEVFVGTAATLPSQ